MADALEMAGFTEEALALPKGSALVGSTGRIGVTMPGQRPRRHHRSSRRVGQHSRTTRPRLLKQS
jgi:hypothetical protein